ncbi:ABC transporter permease [Lichenihabitans sp. PAMC28606]|uniref:cell division protein FtsX n=1 Tax=Lichenihabitans sp. PAMC28606 TaxID=2880932 RepID=UPI001D0AFEEC|nr:ABC transporter permease [Lichenihabitans sp. PAMC28606]UDL93359.1 ABC transporter permease [Lichenihabitans sp. PAMC28606]
MALVKRPSRDDASGAAQTPGRSTPGELALRKDMPLVPISSIAGRALVTVIAIMTFLGSLTAGSAILIAGASRDWSQSVSREMTIQVRPMAGHDIDAEVAKAAAIARATPGVADATVFDKTEAERLLEPWLGQGLDMAELPIPRLIVIRLRDEGGADLAAFRKALTDAVSGVSLDDHHLWLARLATMANTVVVVAVLIFLLVLAAMGLAVAFATRGAMSGNQEIVGVLHFVGAEDRFIAREFQKHFLRLGLKGGLIGGGLACLMFVAAGLVQSWMVATPGGDQLEALFGSFTLGLKGYLAILAIAVGIAFATGITSRTIVFRHLQALE